MDKACSTYRRENAKMHTGFLVQQPEGNRHFEDVDIDGRVILKWILNRMGGCGLD
jgi:hypothetical protein